MQTKIPLNVKGTNDFYGSELEKRNSIINIIAGICQKYNFEQIETPAFEYLDLFKNVYGEESDKLIYYILNSGDFLKNVDLNKGNINDIKHSISEKCLRYDLTLPLMRFIINNFNNITFPFKRCQYQPVWRADKPQKGRFREFLQFDIDIVGEDSLLCEIELLLIINDVFEKLKITDYTTKINHRGVLQNLATLIKCEDKYKDFCVIIDKKDKVGIDQTFESLKENIGLQEKDERLLRTIFGLNCSNDEKIKCLYQLFDQEGIQTNNLDELKTLYEKCKKNNIGNIKLDFSLVRGLSYYTGIIFETIFNYSHVGSVCGGGRYNYFADKLNMKELKSVGMSFGIDRIITALEGNDNLSCFMEKKKKILFLNENDDQFDFNLMNFLRTKGLIVDVYYDSTKDRSKQLKYGDKKHFDYVILHDNEKFICKNMMTGKQMLMERNQIREYNF